MDGAPLLLELLSFSWAIESFIRHQLQFIRQASTVPSSLALSFTSRRVAASSASEADSLSYHPAANPIGSIEQKLSVRTSTEPRLRCFCLSASLIRPCLRDCSFWSDAVGRLLLRRKMAADAIARNYDAVEDGSELFLIAVRRSGSFAKRDARQSLSAHSFGNLIYAWGSLFSPSIPISKCTLVNHRDWPECAETSSEMALHMFKSQQHRARATASGELVKGSTSAEESRKFKTWRAGFVLLTEHRRKNEVGRNKLPLTKDTPSDARSGAAALSRWENEGGSVHDELLM
jgi:hypothetical protein